MRLGIILISLLGFIRIPAQEYKVSTAQADSFSKNFIQLLQCATEKFEPCKGRFLRYTNLQENEYELAIPFPGSAAGIVRFRDWDKNAYVEFRGFSDKKSLIGGMQVLIDKIKKALNDQVIISDIAGKEDDAGMQIANVSIKDIEGYFQPNIELLTGSSSHTYLLSSVDENDKASKEYLILLKIYGGTPSYYHNVPAGIISPDKEMDDLLKFLLVAAAKDFDSLSAPDQPLEKKHRDTIIINGEKILINTGGQNATCQLEFPASNDSLELRKQIKHYRLLIESAVGSSYSYQVSKTGERSEIIYFPKQYNINKPSVELSLEPAYTTGFKMLSITIRSNNTREVKRNLQ